jgi:hypothetical protein
MAHTCIQPVGDARRLEIRKQVWDPVALQVLTTSRTVDAQFRGTPLMITATKPQAGFAAIIR